MNTSVALSAPESVGLSTEGLKHPIALDPAWVAGPLTVHGRMRHNSVLLSDGRVLLMGGDDSSGKCTLALSEYYDPAANTFTGLTDGGGCGRAMVTMQPSTMSASAHGMRSIPATRNATSAEFPTQAAVSRNMRCCLAIGPTKYCAVPQAAPSVRT